MMAWSQFLPWVIWVPVSPSFYLNRLTVNAESFADLKENNHDSSYVPGTVTSNEPLVALLQIYFLKSVKTKMSVCTNRYEQNST